MLNLESVFFPVNSRIKLLVRHVQVHLGRAGSHKVWVAVLSKSWAAAFLLRILAEIMALLICPCPFPLRRLAQSVGRGLVMVLGGGIFAKNSRISNGSSDTLCPCPFRRRRLAQCGSRSWDPSAPQHFPCKFSREIAPLRCPLVKILLKSTKRSLRDLVQFLVKRSCGDPGEVFCRRIFA